MSYFLRLPLSLSLSLSLSCFPLSPSTPSLRLPFLSFSLYLLLLLPCTLPSFTCILSNFHPFLFFLFLSFHSLCLRLPQYLLPNLFFFLLSSPPLPPISLTSPSSLPFSIIFQAYLLVCFMAKSNV